jgi:hypothetical protein
MDVNSRDPLQNIIPFRVKGVEIGRFDSSGNLKIGTTTTTAPTVRLDISGGEARVNSGAATSTALTTVGWIGVNTATPTADLDVSGIAKIGNVTIGANPLYAFTSHTFTNAGATGRTGPALSAVRTEYTNAGASWAATFVNMTTNGIQEWTVPVTGNYTIRAMGAAGLDTRGGKGRDIQLTTTLIKGEVIRILVGQQGSGNEYIQSSGGGGTFVVRDTQTPIIVAGGGGGRGYSGAGSHTHASLSTSGNNATVGGSGGTNGQGGVGSGDGGGGGMFGNGSGNGSEGGLSFINGGLGGIGNPDLSINGGFGGGGGGNLYDGGGGGGGYSGGGGGGSGNGSSGGGGGGSFVITTLTDFGATNTGHGSVTITLLSPSSDFDVSGVSRLTASSRTATALTTTGRIGVNTATPTADLDVPGIAKIGNVTIGANPLYAFTSHTFTNAGATGRLGPTLTNVRTTYTTAGASWATSYLNMTSDNGIQLWTVPVTGIYTIRAKGAAGYIGPGLSNARGIDIQTTTTLIKGEVIKILVGQRGSWQGGWTYLGGGGGGSFVVRDISTPIIIAGGGGGTGGKEGNSYVNSDATRETYGMDGAENPSSGGTNGQGGKGGDGSGGGGFLQDGFAGTNNYIPPASFLTGGEGGLANGGSGAGGFGGGGYAHHTVEPGYPGGGGGGGYSGGGGGRNGYPGGGGGSYAISTMTVNGYNTDHGSVTITLTTPSVALEVIGVAVVTGSSATSPALTTVGRIGVNTATPTVDLDVSGIVNVSNYISVGSGSSGSGATTSILPNAFYIRIGGTNWRDYIPLLSANSTTNIQTWGPIADDQWYASYTAANEIGKQFSYFAAYWLTFNRAEVNTVFQVPVYSTNYSGTFSFRAITLSNGVVTEYQGQLIPYINTNFYNFQLQQDGIDAGVARRSLSNRTILTGVSVETGYLSVTGAAQLTASSATATALTTTGRIGVNTATPQYPVDIVGVISAPTSVVGKWFGTTSSPSNDIASNNIINAPISMRLNGSVWIESTTANAGFWVASDRRIKKNINYNISSECLNLFRQLKCSNYSYIDERANKTNVYGYIAQDVSTVIPYAVTTQKGFIPSLYSLAKISKENGIVKLTCSEQKTYTFHSLHDNQGKAFINDNNEPASDNEGGRHFKVKLFDASMNEYIVRINEILDNGIFTIENDETSIKLTHEEYFVFGQEIDDYKILNNEAIAIVATAALQEVDRQQQADKVRIAELEATVASQQSLINDILERLNKNGL